MNTGHSPTTNRGTTAFTDAGSPRAAPRFDVDVPPRGYAWWYVDALSDDGREGLTLIVFVGSVFSPYYAWSGRRNAEDHCALNVALYGSRHRRWAMTERGQAAVRRNEAVFEIGRSRVRWDADGLLVDIDEPATPPPGRVIGSVRVRPAAVFETTYALDPDSRHHWRPIAPLARAEVTMARPASSWTGHAYLDANVGVEPLEDGFSRWIWSRATLADGSAAVLYDAEPRAGTERNLALHFTPGGDVDRFDAPPVRSLPRGFWGMKRTARSEAGGPHMIRVFEDAPFYTRSLIKQTLFGVDVQAVHESLCLDRLAHPIVRLMLPFRMPRST